MITPVLCLVCFCLLMWVMVLKMEILQLKGDDDDPSQAIAKPKGPSGSSGSHSGVRGQRKFDIT